MSKFSCSISATAMAISLLPFAANAASRHIGGHLIEIAAYVANPSAPLGSVANPIPENSPTPAALAYKILPGDPALVTNGPIPDTAANRARYGEPMSLTGRLSDPTGD